MLEVVLDVVVEEEETRRDLTRDVRVPLKSCAPKIAVYGCILNFRIRVYPVQLGP